jgi:hypothetical protein
MFKNRAGGDERSIKLSSAPIYWWWQNMELCFLNNSGGYSSAVYKRRERMSSFQQLQQFIVPCWTWIPFRLQNKMVIHYYEFKCRVHQKNHGLFSVFNEYTQDDCYRNIFVPRSWALAGSLSKKRQRICGFT